MTHRRPQAERAQRVLLAHGGGGVLTGQLIRDHLLPRLGNDYLAPLTDGAVLGRAAGRLVLTTDSYVVSPLEFPGGDIGRLAVAGTVNDLAVMGARPRALSLGLIIEEGLPFELLDRIVASIAETARQAGVPVVTGDTKVIDRRPRPAGGSVPGAADGLFINTAGLGTLRPDARLGLARVRPGDAILVNAPVAEHGLAILYQRLITAQDPGPEPAGDTPPALQSDARPLNHLIDRMFAAGADIRFLRDATRGGLAGVLADVSEARGLSIEVEEARVPLRPAARHAAELLGLDPLVVANEGVVVCVASAADSDRLLDAMRGHPAAASPARIGTVLDARPPLVELVTRAGGRRVLQRPYGEDLPRIC